jgi:aminopeptidase
VNDPRLIKMAQLLARHSLELKRKDLLVIRTTPLAAPLVLEVMREALKAGAYPYLRAEIEGTQEIFLKEAAAELLDFLNPVDVQEMEHVDAILSILAPFNNKALSGVEPSCLCRWQKTRDPLFKRHLERDATGQLRWNVTLFPTHASAQEAGMSLADYCEFAFAAMHLEEEDPTAYWLRFRAEQEHLVQRLSRGREIRVLGRGTDLSVRIEGRTWINSYGRHNIPDGEVYTGPLEASARGHILFTFPTIYQQREVEGVRLVFEDGKCVKAEANRGQDFLLENLDLDLGARYLGEFAFGNNDGIRQFSKDLLFDEKIGGTMHIALGASYPQTGGQNVSAIHWDMVCDLREESEVRLDGEVIQRNGKWLSS